MAFEDRPPTVGERYARASVTSDLRVKGHSCDADLLLAAGYAASGNPRKGLALRLYRMKITGDMGSVSSIVADSDCMLAGRLTRRGNRPMHAYQRHELVTSTLRWWMRPTCGYCQGRGLEIIEGAPALSAEECAACHGTGHTPLSRVVHHRAIGHAKWLVDEWDTLCAIVIGDMAQLLRNELP